MDTSAAGRSADRAGRRDAGAKRLRGCRCLKMTAAATIPPSRLRRVYTRIAVLLRNAQTTAFRQVFPHPTSLRSATFSQEKANGCASSFRRLRSRRECAEPNDSNRFPQDCSAKRMVAIRSCAFPVPFQAYSAWESPREADNGTYGRSPRLARDDTTFTCILPSHKIS